MSEGLGENSRLLDYSGKMYNQEENGNVLQLRDWLDDPYEQVSELPSQRYAGTDDGKLTQLAVTNNKFPPPAAVKDNPQQPIRLAKVAALSSLMLVSLVTSMFYIEESKDSYLMTSCKSAMKTITIDDISYCNRLAIEITGNIEDEVYTEPLNGTIKIILKKSMTNQTGDIVIDDPVYIKPTRERTTKIKEMTKIEHLFTIDSLKNCARLSLIAEPKDENACASVNLSYQCRSPAQDYSVVVALILLVVVYALIMTEIIHRTSAALLGASLGVAALSILNMRPDLEMILGWIDWETLALLMGMMLMVALLADSGFFDWAAVKMYELSKGRIWVLITLLNVGTAVMSAFLDNVTTILLITPITIT